MTILARTQMLARPQSPLGRELVLLLAALAIGLVLVPWLIWIIGRLTLGDYAHGGPLALWGDFFRGLYAGSLAFWIALLGPYVLLLSGRVLRRLIRKP